MASNTLRSIRRGITRSLAASTAVVALVELTTHLPSQGRSSEFYHDLADSVVTPLLRKYLDPERAHNVALFFASIDLSPVYRTNAIEQSIDMSTKVCGIKFPNPIGLAAGFDKNGEAILSLQRMGFGYVEIGSVTPLPQPGNPKPRMFRLVQEGAIINRYGFNSLGLMTVCNNLKLYRKSLEQIHDNKIEGMKNSSVSSYLLHVLKLLFPAYMSSPSTLVGVNLGKNKVSEVSEVDDYCQGIRELGPYADYLVINVSSPNTPGLRDLQAPDSLKNLVQACLQERNKLQKEIPKPLLVKLAPDLSDNELRDIADTLIDCKVDGLIISNTTNQRPSSLVSQNSKEVGGLSGRPLKSRSTECIRLLYAHTSGSIPIIGVGGVSDAHDAFEKLKAGASLVQLYSVLAYEGAGVVTRIRHDLAKLVREEGFSSVEDVVGYDHEELYWKKKQEKLLQKRKPGADEVVLHG